VRIRGIDIQPGVMNAACSEAKSIENVRTLAATRIGAIVVGSITLKPREGNPPPQWYAGEHYALNSFGMPNNGAAFYREHLPEMISLAHESGKKFILSVAGFAPDDYAQLATLADEAGVDILELNLGCPNVSVGGEQKPIVSFDTIAMTEIIDRVSEATDIPLTLKLSPYSNPSQLKEVAEAIAASGKVAGVVTSNTFANGYMEERGQPVIASEYGGVSGRALFPIALGQVRQFRRALPEEIAVIGVGGVESKDDVNRYLQAGADGVQAATLIVRDGHHAINKLV